MDPTLRNKVSNDDKASILAWEGGDEETSGSFLGNADIVLPHFLRFGGCWKG